MRIQCLYSKPFFADMAKKQCLADLPRPTFFGNGRYLGLPWMNPSEPHFVMSYLYDLYRAKGEPFEQDGIGGLIQAGYFGSLVLPMEIKGLYDQGTLDAYFRRPDPCEGSAIFVRKDRTLGSP